MEKGFSITNVDIIGKVPHCDLSFSMEGEVVFKKEKVSFEELKQLMLEIKQNCDSVSKQVDSFKSRR